MCKKSLPAGVRFLLGFVSFLLCLLLFVSALATMLVADVRVLTDKDNLQQLITQAFFPSSAPVRTPVRYPAGLAVGRPVIRQLSPDLLGSFDTDALAEVIYDMLSEQFGEEVPISEEQVKEFLDASTIPEFFAEKAAGLVSDIFIGESTTTMTKEDVADLIRENADLIKDIFDITVPEDEIDEIAGAIEENNFLDTIQKEVAQITGMQLPTAGADTSDATDPTSGSSTSNPSIGISQSDQQILSDLINKGEFTPATLPALLNAVRSFTSQTALLLCIGVCVLLTALLFAVNRRNIPAAMRCSGIPYLCAGILLLIPSAVAAFVPAIWTDSVGRLIRQILLLAGGVSLTVTVIGLALLIGSGVVSSILRKKNAQTAAQSAAEVPGDFVEEASAALMAEEAEEATEM